MPNREKLIELLDQCDRCNAEYCNRCEFGNDIDGCVLRKKQIISDTLLANGVTVQKWIPVTERLPDRNDQIIAFYETMRDTHAAIQIHKAWAMTDACTHWMPLPEPPKEE